MALWKKLSKRQAKKLPAKRLRFEQLEDKRPLAIVWANEFGTGVNDPNFDDEYQGDEVVARSIVNRAIDDWEAVINSFNYDVDSDGNRSNDLDVEEKGTFYLFQ